MCLIRFLVKIIYLFLANIFYLMNTRYLYLIVILLFSIKVLGTDYRIDKSIVWKDSINTVPTFHDAIYFQETGKIPYIYNMIEFPFYPNPTFTINSIQNSTLSLNTATNVITFLKTNNVQFNFVVEKSGSSFLLKYWYPAIQKSITGDVRRIDKISYTVSVEPRNRIKASSVDLSSVENSKLASGKWYKFEVIKNGVYKISKKELSNLGISVSKSVRVFTFPKDSNSRYNKASMFDDLYEIPVYYSDGGDGVFNGSDYLLFYGESADKWWYDSKNDFLDHSNSPYSLSNYYYILIDDGEPLKITTTSSSLNSDYTANTFVNCDYHENDETNILQSGQEWFEPIPVDGIKFSLIDPDGADVSFKTRTVTESSSALNYSFYNNGNAFHTISMSGGGSESSLVSKVNYFTQTVSESTLKLSLSETSGSTSKSYLDDIVINYRSKLNHTNKQVLFYGINTYKKYSAPKYNISTTGAIQVWNIFDINNPKQVQLTEESTGKSFVYPSDTLERFVAFNENECYIPTYKGIVKNQNLHSFKNVDMIIVAADDFVSQANQLKDLHYNLDGIQSVVVTQNQIFNEFSGGRSCPEAIRDFARYIYTKGGNRLSFIILFGDGSYDNFNVKTNNFIITFETKSSLLGDRSIVTDDFFGLLDEGEGIDESDNISGALDLAIGRIPVSTVEDANVVVKKATNYCSGTKTRGDWRNRLLFLADDADGGDVTETVHMTQSNELADSCILINSNLITDKVFLDAYPQESIAGGQRYPTVNKTIESKIKNGCLIFNYTGHGNPLRMASEIVVDKSEVEKWQNPDALPLFIAASCQVGRFDDEERNCLGEDIILSNHGGGIAIIAATRSVYSSYNMDLNMYIYDYMFNLSKDGKPQYLGQVLKLAKNKAVSDVFNKHNFEFLGDPAIRLALPIYNVVTDKVNGVSINSTIDTLKALASVTISGHIEDLGKSKLSSYNGTIHAVVFDKPQTVTTLSNDGAPALTFKSQNNILFKGKATVSNGDFLISFIVPKDIYYNYGNGRISYYADNGILDAAGSFKQFIIGGSSNKTLEKNGGPMLNLFMNDTNFVYGGVTNASPTLLVKAKDSYGINVSGSSVGHDATAIFDGSKSDQVILNQFYESDKNTYKTGTFKYPVSTLDEGKHSVNVKVWNINNELTQESLEFYVENSASLALSHVLNYPNPFTTSTNFYFEHNQTNQVFDVLIQIYTITGKLVKTISTNYYTDGNRSIPISWDGNDDYGDKIGRGVYIYKVRVKNEQQQIAEKMEKLVILK